ncbi:RNA 2',3'-cyclic phosphodiesterase [Marinilabilia salmonicolor]|uniref:RNA 2',3'-cyclic phosphodiesterase n=1 Tax=Marinilabilia salmonicolor TaxID=989 RepID=UPI00029A4431|nr:RNA 2',3'-cyclic phosphodiesterase [Marinilabilia salmonicolor]
MEKIRIFLGVGLGKISLLNEWMITLRQLGYDDQLRWTRPDQWHITLKFIGSFSVSSIPELAGKLRNGFNQKAGEQLVVKGAGFFGSLQSPKVLWAGVERSDWLDELNKIAEDICLETGIPESPKPFSPHLTLARIRKLKRPVRLIEEVKRQGETLWDKVRVNEVGLYKSELTPDGPEYSVLNKFKLLI